jgi:hypothetical protein
MERVRGQRRKNSSASRWCLTVTTPDTDRCAVAAIAGAGDAFPDQLILIFKHRSNEWNISGLGLVF